MRRTRSGGFGSGVSIAEAKGWTISGHIGLKSHRKLPQCLQKLRSDPPRSWALAAWTERFSLPSTSSVFASALRLNDVPSATGRLAAYRAIARLIRIRRRRFDPKLHRPTVAASFEKHHGLPAHGYIS